MPRITRATVLMKPMFVSYRKGRTFENMYNCLLSNKHHQYIVESFVDGSWLSVERTTLSAVVYSSCPLRRTGSTLPPKLVFLLSKFEMTINRNGHFLRRASMSASVTLLGTFPTITLPRRRPFRTGLTLARNWPARFGLRSWRELAAVVDCDHSSAFIAHVPVENL